MEIFKFRRVSNCSHENYGCSAIKIVGKGEGYNLGFISLHSHIQN